ncbi:MAG TPA: glycoside hydrolase family 43 protein [Verrucomicrobiae bacterium]|nr:glycoside hydrolase family 43 protein [Verrucomicrobiae bacterium]
MASASTTHTPVYPEYFADPYVWRAGKNYFAIGTGEHEASGGIGARVFPLLQSSDLQHWKFIDHALVPPASLVGTHFWAPEVVEHEHRFYLYYSAGFGDKGHQLRVAASDHAHGPFHDLGHALVDPNACSFAIDAHAFRDDDGQWYLFYARDFLQCSGDQRPGTALMAARMKSMTEIENEGQVVLRARHDWQRFERDRPMYGGRWDWHTLEGPFLRKHGGRYYCFYSGGRWENESYGVDYAVADHVLGPYSDAGGEARPRVLRTIPGGLLGPGHNSVITGPDGKTDFLVYHAWDSGMTARRMFIEPLVWTADGPRAQTLASVGQF